MKREDVLIVLAAAAGVALYAWAGGGGFPLDDAWIHQTYARSLAERGEWAFVPGEPSGGSTSPLWTALVALGYTLGVPYALWTYALGALCLALAGVLAARLAARLFPGLARVGLWAGLAVVLEWHLVWAAASGMETVLFAALSVGVVLAAQREASLRAGLAVGVLGGLLTLARPEGVGLVGLAAIFVFGAHAAARRPLVMWAGGAAAGWALGAAPGLLLNLSLTGSLLPNTASAKQAEYAALLALPYPQRFAAVGMQLFTGVMLPLLPGLVGSVLSKAGERGRALLPLGWAAALVALYAARLPVNYQYGRYVMPALPHLVVLGVGGTLLLLRAGRRRMWRRVLARTLAGTAALTLLIFWASGVSFYRRDVRFIQTEMVAAARYLAREVPPEALLAVHDIGAVGYFAPRPILDLAGLVTPEVVPVIRDGEALLALMEARGADYLMTFPDWSDAYRRMVADPRVQKVHQVAGTSPGESMTIYRLIWEKKD